MALAKKRRLKKEEPIEHIDGDFYVLGCDLSMTCPGFAVLSYCEETRSANVVRIGHVMNKGQQKKAHGKILNEISAAFSDFASNKNIKVAIRERAFSKFNVETQTIHKVVGVTEMLLWHISETKFIEYTPTSVKKIITGGGRASKEEVAEAMDNYLPDHPKFKTDDESDACAVALSFLVENGYIDPILLPQYTID